MSHEKSFPSNFKVRPGLVVYNYPWSPEREVFSHLQYQWLIFLTNHVEHSLNHIVIPSHIDIIPTSANICKLKRACVFHFLFICFEKLKKVIWDNWILECSWYSLAKVLGLLIMIGHRAFLLVLLGLQVWAGAQEIDWVFVVKNE